MSHHTKYISLTRLLSIMNHTLSPIISLIIFTSLFLAPPDANALNPAKKLTQYMKSEWTIANGLPYNSILRVIQTSDGYMWFVIRGNLVRYDGLTFTVHKTPHAGETIFVCQQDRQHNLWLGTNKGLYRFEDGEFNKYKRIFDFETVNVTAIYEDHDRNLWVSAFETGYQCLFRIKDNDVTQFTNKNGFTNNLVSDIYEDSSHRLWFCTAGDGLYSLQQEKFSHYTTLHGLGSNVCATVREDKNGNIWIGTTGGLNCFKNDQFKLFTTRNGLACNAVKRLCMDNDHNMWIATDMGLSRFKKGTFINYTQRDGLISNQVEDIYEDREKNLWIGTVNGLNKFHDGKFTLYTMAEGLSQDVVNVVLKDSSNNLWIGTSSGLDSFQRGKMKHYTIRNGLLGNTILALHEDRKRTLWIGTSQGLTSFKNGQFNHYTKKQGLSSSVVTAIKEDKKANLWLGTQNGLNKFRNGLFTSYAMDRGMTFDRISCLYVDRDQHLWVGSWGLASRAHGTSGDLIRFKDGKFQTLSQLGIPADILSGIQVVFEDSERNLWIGTWESGLIKIRKTQVSHYSTRNGLIDDTIYAILEDNDKNLWLSSSKGIFRISINDFDLLDAGKRDILHTLHFGLKDGLKNPEGTSGGGFAARDKEGRVTELFFPTMRGLCTINPDQILTNTTPPTVHIEYMKVNDVVVQPQPELKLARHRNNVYFKFTALSFVYPQAVKFQYRLQGFDESWIGSPWDQRAVRYTNLSQGSYSFTVKACNNDGVWNQTAPISFTIRPALTETNYFFGLCAIAIILIGYSLYRIRVARLKQQERQLKKKVDEQTHKIKRINDNLRNSNLELLQAYEELEVKNDELQKRRLDIEDSLHYAEQLQQVILPHERELEPICQESFIISLPREIVGGDFYWFYPIPKSDNILVAVIDCTGHGVPGAFMTMIGHSILNDMAIERKLTEPARIMKNLHHSVRTILRQEAVTAKQYDSMEGCICLIEPRKNRIVFSGAKRSIYLSTNGEVKKYSGIRKSIGGRQREKERIFTSLEIPYTSGTILYMFTDGLIDQAGFDERKRRVKFGTPSFEQWLRNHYHLPLDEQENLLLESLKKFQSTEKQRDDITVVALKFK
ncbi:two-component regulator propeller domain-containing protein [candidate division CSSED10-310 bacterium]|uniref:Two-component regulator propeller domain-containing protein n=1 Tax=candidate division CSSED10-310 bacterium TaxID=2855610 RepID=A0ABV6YU66_UNCC1